MVTGLDPSVMKGRSDPTGVAIKLIKADGFIVIDNCNMIRKIKRRLF
jgi:hypothetical protein